MAGAAARLAPPENPRLKPQGELKLVGRSLAKVDIPSKVDGSAIFGIDFVVPGMLLAAVRTAPSIGGTLKSFDEAAIRRQPGVHAVVPQQNGVAVVADTWWRARTALAAGKLEFELGPTPIWTVPRSAKPIAGPWTTAPGPGRSMRAMPMRC